MTKNEVNDFLAYVNKASGVGLIPSKMEIINLARSVIEQVVITSMTTGRCVGYREMALATAIDTILIIRVRVIVFKDHDKDGPYHYRSVSVSYKYDSDKFSEEAYIGDKTAKVRT